MQRGGARFLVVHVDEDEANHHIMRLFCALPCPTPAPPSSSQSCKFPSTFDLPLSFTIRTARIQSLGVCAWQVGEQEFAKE